ncbi:DUF3108 domain-containing protein [Janthinobacterium sp. 17J80-10]|uniref:DUF3108 domain-containing protein n=1 Tax=Janthinobacterium sp. 17J80-10 TaxID=2497863 RepID=UPI0010059B06|nr:DUF3108 domain-containing protein [Janthinobacterium sp. 17J80-10]QAU33312.1 DUF3108 domain-containing protein [Janthinobacterium sp. 17J80-10]
MNPIFRFLCGYAATAVLTAGMALPAQAADAPSLPKRPFNLPPSADLDYVIKARHSGVTLDGSALVKWQAAAGKYLLNVEARAMLLGKLQTSTSEGAIDAYGLAPATATEKTFRKRATSVAFNRDTGMLSFSASEETYPLMGGEQDRSSITWQLVGNARAAAKKFMAGSNWPYFVAGRTDAQPWNFIVGKTEKVTTPMGVIDAIRVARQLPTGSDEQQLDIWLAPALEWYPVKIRFSEEGGEVIEQTLQKITRK